VTVEIEGRDGYMQENQCPIRLRGYSELAVTRIPAEVRKKICSAIRNGFTRSKGRENYLISMISKFNPIERISVGYIGKQKLRIPMPTKAQANSLLALLQAVVVMSENIDKSELRVGDDRSEGTFPYVWVSIYTRSDRDNKAPQLKSLFGSFMSVITQNLDEWKDMRERVAKWVEDDKSVIRIPFDTHK
jgi:hypothetical protein